MENAIVGREAELVVVERFLESVPTGPAALLIEGGAGVGKTTVWLEGVRVAEWPADDDPILLNSPYADGIPTMLIYQGLLEPFQG